MLDEPYRWIEAVAHRREYLEDQLRAGSPVVGLGYDNGVLLLTIGGEQRKLFEVYDRIAFSAIGHPADLEKLRSAAIDMAHIEGFSKSVEDVTLQRLVHFGIAPMMKQGFDEVFRSPYTAKVLMAELAAGKAAALFYSINYDGSFKSTHGYGVLGGTEETEKAMWDALRKASSSENWNLEEAIAQALTVWTMGRKVGELKRDSGSKPSSFKDLDKSLKESIRDQDMLREVLARELESGSLQVALLERSRRSRSKFRMLPDSELSAFVSGYLSSKER